MAAPLFTPRRAYCGFQLKSAGEGRTAPSAAAFGARSTAQVTDHVFWLDMTFPVSFGTSLQNFGIRSAQLEATIESLCGSLPGRIIFYFVGRGCQADKLRPKQAVPVRCWVPSEGPRATASIFRSPHASPCGGFAIYRTDLPSNQTLGAVGEVAKLAWCVCEVSFGTGLATKGGPGRPYLWSLRSWPLSVVDADAALMHAATSLGHGS